MFTLLIVKHYTLHSICLKNVCGAEEYSNISVIQYRNYVSIY